MSLQSRFRIGQRVKYRTRTDGEWRDAKVVAFSPGGNYVHVSTDATAGAMALSEAQARKQLLAPGEDPVLVQLTDKQRELFERARGGAYYIAGSDVRTARALAAIGLVELEDNGFMSQDGSGRSDGERWGIKLKLRGGS